MGFPLTPLRFKRRAVQLYGRKTGVVCGASRFTYQEFSDRADRLARGLERLGIPRGARVAFLALNCHRLLEAYYGVVQMGGVLLPLNVRLSPAELAFILQDSGAAALFYDSEFSPLVEALRPRLGGVEHFIPLDATAGSSYCYEQLLAEAGDGPFEGAEPSEEDVAEIFYTSGTTGRPKGVMLTHRNLYLHALSGIIALGLRDTDIQLHAIPLFHVNGWGAPQSLTCMGGTHVMMRRFAPDRVLELIRSEGVTCTSFVPTMVHALLNDPALSGRSAFSTLRMVLIGGAAPSVEMVRQVEARFGCPCYTGYGLTETSPILTIATPKGTVAHATEEDLLRRRAMTGWPLVGVELRVVDDKGREVLHDGRQVGEILARSDGLMKGYWQVGELAAPGGWFHTGDMATVDEEGFFQIVDRKKDIIVSGGENIASIEIEQRLCAHDAVAECAVVARPDSVWGEVPAAFVVLREGSAATEQELLAFCRSELASFKCPRSVIFLESLPKGGTGKILKNELRRIATEKNV